MNDISIAKIVSEFEGSDYYEVTFQDYKFVFFISSICCERTDVVYNIKGKDHSTMKFIINHDEREWQQMVEINFTNGDFIKFRNFHNGYYSHLLEVYKGGVKINKYCI